MEKILILIFLILVVKSFAASKVELKANGLMLLNGRPKFVFGAYRDPSDNWRDFSGIKKAGFNMVHDYYFENGRGYKGGMQQWIKDAKSYLALAKKNDVGVFLGIPRKLIHSAKFEEIKQLVNAVKDEDALWFWYLYDEPSHRKKHDWDQTQTVDQILKKAYGTIKEADPNHPVVIVDSSKWVKKYPDAVRYCDTIWADCYSIPYSSTNIGRDVLTLKEIFPDKVIWAVPVATTNRPFVKNTVRKKYSKEYFVPKTIHTDQTNNTGPKAIVSQFHASIAAGAKGVIYYWLPKYMVKIDRDTPRAWQALIGLGKLVKELQPILVSTDKVSSKVQVSNDMWGLALRNRMLFNNALSKKQLYSIRPVMSWQRMYKGELYMGFTNDYCSTQKVKVKLPYRFTKIVQYPGGKTVVELKDGKLKLNHKALKVQIWMVKKDMSEIFFLMQDMDSVVFKFVK